MTSRAAAEIGVHQGISRRGLFGIWCCLAFVQHAAARAPVAGTEPARHEFVIKDFKTEGGVVLPEARIVWAVSHPDFMDDTVASAGTAKTYGHGIVRLEGEIAALTADAAFHDGDYTEQPAKGIEAFAIVWTGWLYSQEWWRRELWREDNPPGTSLAQVMEQYRKHFIPGGDANDLILQMRTWESHAHCRILGNSAEKDA